MDQITGTGKADQPVSQTYLFVSVEDRQVGDVEVETTSGETIVDEVVVLDLLCFVDAGTKVNLTLAVPKSAGYQLLKNLLTSDQLEAAMYAESDQ